MLCPLSDKSISLMFLLYFLRVAVAQSFNIPSSWTNTETNIGYATRLDLAKGAAGEVHRQSDPETGFPADHKYNSTVSNMAIVLASQDLLSGNTSWKDQVVAHVLAYYESGQGDIDNRIDNIDLGYWGLAEIAAHLAYNDDSRLQFARRNFDIMQTDFVSASAAESQVYPRTLQTSCPASTLTGLLFAEHTDTGDLLVLSSFIGSWIALSARLYELTKNTTYLDAAAASVQFMNTSMIKSAGKDFSLADSFNITSCTPDQADLAADDVGLYIEGLSVLANVTANQTYTQLLEALVPAITTYGPWHTENGILTEDSDFVTKGTLIRGLFEARQRNPGNAGFTNLIDDYLTIQFNAVQLYATSSGSDDYSDSWHTVGGTPQYSTLGSIQALDVLNAAFAIAPRPAPPDPPRKHVNIGVIVGAAVGGVVAALLVALGIVCLRRRRNARERLIRDNEVDIAQEPSLPVKTEMVTEPFVLPSDRHKPSVESSAKKGDIVLEYREGPQYSSPGSDPEAADTSIAPTRSTRSEHVAVAALERRLDNLIQALAVHGETRENPPGYEGTDPISGNDGCVS